MNKIKSNPKRDAPCANCGLGKLEAAGFVCTVLLISVSIISMIGLKELQRDKYRHAVDALTVNDGIGICVELSRFVFDAEYVSNPNKLETERASAKRKLLGVVGNLLAAAEADDRQRMVEMERALHAFIYSFERRMSMPHGDTAIHKERDALKASLDEQVGMLGDLLCDHESALRKKAHEADAAYESRFASLVWLATGTFLLVAWLVFLVIGESREMDRSHESGAWR